MAKSTSKTLSFVYEKETKGTFRFAEDGDDPMVGTLYVRKSALNGTKVTEDTVLTMTIDIA